MIIERLGISPSDREILVNNLDVVINCAASVNFEDPLHVALNINYFGSLRMLELAKECKNIKAYCQVSTCYVNSNLPSGELITEEIYNEE
jgi:thioester reductase-like protein